MAKAVHSPSQLEWDTPLYQQARTQLEHALALADVPDFVSTRLRHPEQAIILTLPVQLDDGGYATKVLDEQNNLRLVASGRNVPVLGNASVTTAGRPVAPAASAAPAAAAVGTAAGLVPQQRLALLR